MLPNLDKVQYFVGDREILLGISKAVALPVYSEKVVSFLSDLSAELMKDRELRQYKDIMGYAYWIRKASILPYKSNISRIGHKIGRGLTFHIAPSNIPIQFALSMVHALLAGNACVIRVPTREFPQVMLLCNKISGLLREDHRDLAGHLCIIRYGHDDEITTWLSSICDVRIIWGGDETVRRIRAIPIPPRSTELVFADRYSFAIIDSDELLKANVKEVVNDFWTDTYFVDQNACSSPRLVAWTGTEKEKAREVFWGTLHDKAEKEYEVSAIFAVDKLSSFARLSMATDLAGGGGLELENSDSYLYRVMLDRPSPGVMEYKGGGGYFFECPCDSLETLVPLMDNKACQTVALFGIPPKKVYDIVFERGLKGVDRIVNIGNATAPGLDWDGYALVDSLSRYVEVEDLCC